MRAFQQSVANPGSVGRMTLALSLAPVAAALGGMVAGGIFHLVSPGEPLPLGSNWLGQLLTSLFFFFFAATMVEIAVGLPLFLLFRRFGWLTRYGFVAGAAIIAVLLESLLNEEDAPRLIVIGLLLLPSLAGTLTFGYAGGWLPSPSHLSDILPPS